MSFVPSAAATYAMLENESLWQVTETCHTLLEQAGIPHLVVGGVAVCLHGYRRNTVDLDLLVRPVDQAQIREVLLAGGFSWHETSREFRSQSGVPVQFLLSGDSAGKGAIVRLPDADDSQSEEVIESLPVISLPRLIEMKLACGVGNLRRTHKDFADVVELIVLRQLDGSFARFLHKSLRKTYRELVRHARGE